MKKIITLWVLVIPALTSLCQPALKPDKEKIANTPAKSGTSYEALTQFLQVNVTSEKGGGYTFKSTLFSIQKFFSKDSLNASDIYLAKKGARNLELGLGLHKGSQGNLGLLLPSIKYALVNNRDKSDVNFALEDNGALDKDIQLILNARHNALTQYSNEIAGKPAAEKATLEKELDAADMRFAKSNDFKEYPKRVLELYNQEIKAKGRDPEKFLQEIQDVYDRIAKKIEQRGLLTLSFNPGYDWNTSNFDTTTVNLQYLKGWGNFQKPWNFDIKISQLFQQDTSNTKSLSRQVFMGKLGINKVLVHDSKLNPLVEFELAYEHDYIFNGLYKDEDRNRPKMVSTLRVHVSKDIFIPLTLKYDLKNPNLFGVFRLQWDLQTGKK